MTTQHDMITRSVGIVSPVRLHSDSIVFDALATASILEEEVAEQYLRGGVTAANVAVLLEQGWEESLSCVEAALAAIERSGLLLLARSEQDVRRAKASGRMAVVLGSQGASFIDGTADSQLYRIEILARLGLRVVGLAYTARSLLGDGCGERRDGGLSFLGREFVASVNELPLALDLSHCSHATRREAAEIARLPVCTHSNAYALTPNDRNTKDDAATTIAGKGGVIGVAALPAIVSATAPSLTGFLAHMRHFHRLLGARSVGFGLDFVVPSAARAGSFPASLRWRRLRPDIFGQVEDFGRTPYPTGLASIEELPEVTRALLDEGYAAAEVESMIGGNWMRALFGASNDERLS